MRTARGPSAGRARSERVRSRCLRGRPRRVRCATARPGSTRSSTAFPRSHPRPGSRPACSGRRAPAGSPHGAPWRSPRRQVSRSGSPCPARGARCGRARAPGRAAHADRCAPRRLRPRCRRHRARVRLRGTRRGLRGRPWRPWGPPGGARMRTIRLPILAALVLGCATAGALAHAQALGGRRMREPAFLRELFPPALIMQHQADIALTDAQRDAISKEMANAEKATVELRWQLEAKTAALGKLLAADTVDEAAALKQADEVLALEDRLKRLRLGFLIRVKNVLTPAQQDTLRKLRRR